MHQQKPLIKLWDAVGLGLIICCQTGVLISNQTGGTTCLQSAIEGIYVPLCNDHDLSTGAFLSPETALKRYFTGDKYAGSGAIDGLDVQDAEHIAGILAKYGLQDFIMVDADKLKQSHEAWVHVTVNTDKDTGLLSNFGKHLVGVLTWTSSD